MSESPTVKPPILHKANFSWGITVLFVWEGDPY